MPSGAITSDQFIVDARYASEPNPVYEVHVTPGRSRSDLGTTSKFAFKVV